MDRLECGQCSTIFTKLDLFIQHKQLGCDKDVLPQSIDGGTPSNDSSQKFRQPLEGDQYPLKFRDLSPYIIKKQIVKNIKKRDEPGDRIRRLKAKILQALPPGYCGTCSSCLTRIDCGDCVSCTAIPRDEPGTSKPKERCLMRVCEQISTSHEYQVEKLLDKKDEPDEPYYLVKWKGYPNSANTWEPVSNILSTNLIEEYESSSKSFLKRKHMDEISGSDPKILKTSLLDSLGLNEKSVSDSAKDDNQQGTTLADSSVNKPANATSASSDGSKKDIALEPKTLLDVDAKEIQNEEEKHLMDLNEFLSFDKVKDSQDASVDEKNVSDSPSIVEMEKNDGDLKESINIDYEDSVPESALKKTARKSLRGSVPDFSRRQLELILKEIQHEAEKARNPNLSGSEVEEVVELGSTEGQRLGRSTKKAALDFIRSICKGVKKPDLTEEEKRSKVFNRTKILKDVPGIESYEEYLEGSKSYAGIYIPDPEHSDKMILVNGLEDHIKKLEGANLNPTVMIRSKTPLRKCQYALDLEEMEQQEKFLKELLDGDDDDDLYGEFGEDEDLGDDEYFYSERYSTEDMENNGLEALRNSPPKKKAVKQATPTPLKSLTDSASKRGRGRPKKNEAEAKRMVLKAKGLDKAEVKSISNDIDLTPGARRKKGKPMKFSEYIDPDTVVGEEEEVGPRSDISAAEDDDFEPPQNLKPATGRGRGRPVKQYNINDLEIKEITQKFTKSKLPSKADLASRDKPKKNRVFVVMPDGTMVEVSGNDKAQAIKKATAKMESAQKRAGNKKVDGDFKRDKGFQKPKTDMRPLLEECTNDAIDDANTLKLPNTVQLVESELPLSEAENAQSLVGMYLFRQIYSPNDSELFCKLCKGKVTLRYPADLEKHYHVIHEIAVQIFKAEFSENIVFVCVPGDVTEETILNSGCRFCDITLRTLSEVREHYPSCHTKDVRFIPENAVLELGDRFYCSVCSNASVDFATHHDHMKNQHSMQTYTCKHCNFCTPKPNRLRTHFKQRHLQEQPGPHLQCSVCSVYVHGREKLNKHILLSHAVQTGTKTWSCAKCLQPCGDAKDLMTHIPSCPYVKTQALEQITIEIVPPVPTSEASTTQTSNNLNNNKTIFFKCTICALTFTSETEIKKHMSEGIHNNNIIGEVSLVSGSAEEKNENTCFLCSLKFSSADLLKTHLHHIHMRWVAKGAVDYTSKELEDSPDELAEELEIIKEMEKIDSDRTPDKNQTNEEQELIRQLENELEGMTAEKSQSNNEENKNETHPLIGPDISVEVKQSTPIKMSDLPNEAALAEIGFPSKSGHYCHLCDTVIKSYTLFYLHMHNLHGLEKRFQCVLSSCSHTFKSVKAFNRHSQNHNQKSESFCSMCDQIFGSDEDLEGHFMTHEHATKYMRVQEKYNRSEPRNYRCKVCHCWYGLFATFVKHMETENHSYKCQHCGLVFVQPGPRRNHIQSVHPDLANICEICGTRLQNSQALWSHLSLHNIVYECQKCHRRFLQKEQLTAHMEIHAPPTPCPWEGCNRKLSTKVGLYNHLRMHKGDADFTCTICNKGFFKKKTLEIHMKSHDKNTPRKPVKSKASPQEQSVEPQLQIDESSVQNVNQELTAPSVELIQFICAGCLNGFDSEEKFAAHECTGHATQEQVDAAAAAAGVLNQDQILTEAAESAEQTHMITEDDLAAQLAQAVAEATTQSQMTYSSSSHVTMSDGTVVTMTTMDSDGNALPNTLQNLVDGKGGTVLASADSSGNITFIRTSDENIQENQEEDQLENFVSENQMVPQEENEGEQLVGQTEEPMDCLENTVEENQAGEEYEELNHDLQDGEDESSHQTLYLTEEEALLAAQSGQLQQNSEGTFIMHSGEGQEGEEDGSIVMMVANDEEGNEHQIMDGNQPYSIVKVPTEDGGEQVLLIPLNREGGNTVLTLPPNMMLSEEGEDTIETSAVAYQEEETTEDGENIQQTFLHIPEGTDVQGLLDSVVGQAEGQNTVLGSQLENELINSVTQ